ncbi:hypothetical protein LX36DRAFT_650720 [Colletotrichum falcatum]|nr:hypothetical protein LX36DRAFT_650720 [Colletotrichum falcatum]
MQWCMKSGDIVCPEEGTLGPIKERGWRDTKKEGTSDADRVSETTTIPTYILDAAVIDRNAFYHVIAQSILLFSSLPLPLGLFSHPSQLVLPPLPPYLDYISFNYLPAINISENKSGLPEAQVAFKSAGSTGLVYHRLSLLLSLVYPTRKPRPIRQALACLALPRLASLPRLLYLPGFPLLLLLLLFFFFFFFFYYYYYYDYPLRHVASRAYSVTTRLIPHQT